MIAWRIAAIVLPIVGAILIPGVCAEGAPMVENIRFSNGDTWAGEGEFDDNGRLMNGKGIYKWANGVTYDGEWLDNMAHGEGKVTYKDGREYSGDWHVGKRHGFGIYTSMWKAYQYKGGWSNDKMHGKGVKSYFWHFIECKEEWDHGKLRGVVLWWMFRIHRKLADVKATASWLRCKIEKLKHDEWSDDDDCIVRLDQDHKQCGICYEAFTTDMESTDQNSREKLPVLGSCGHYFCHGCIIRCRTMVGSNGAVGCPKCMKANQFVLGNPIHHRMLIDLLERALPVENLRRGQ
eukprot:scaffold16520_cov151-Skeletonema_marinoi.AAC.5